MVDLATTEATGPFQGEAIVRTGLIQALYDLRQRPQELDAIWASLVQDPVTSRAEGYGVNQVEQAKKWFLSRDIDVFLNVRVPDNTREGSFLTVSILKSDEATDTLGDAHWGSESVEADEPLLSVSFSPVSYNPQTRLLVIPSAVVPSGGLTAETLVLTDEGQELSIEEVVSPTSVKLAATSRRPVLRNLRLRWPRQSHRVALGSAVFRETYGIGCHSYQEPIHAIYLHAVVAHILLRYRKEYLETRGLQVSSFSTGALDVDQNFGSELGYSRFIQLTGMVQHVWALTPSPTVQGLAVQVQVTGAGKSPDRPLALDDNDDLSWIGDQDPVGLRFL